LNIADDHRHLPPEAGRSSPTVGNFQHARALVQDDGESPWPCSPYGQDSGRTGPAAGIEDAVAGANRCPHERPAAPAVGSGGDQSVLYVVPSGEAIVEPPQDNRIQSGSHEQPPSGQPTAIGARRHPLNPAKP
jgi:hypothetical protein